MEITRDQAQELLQAADDAGRNMRTRRAYGPVGPILMLWGVVWIVCFSIARFAPAASGWVWLVGDALGLVGSIYLGWTRERAEGERSAASKRLGRRLAAFWFLLFIYGDIWIALLTAGRGANISCFVVTLVMFAYVVMGLWLERYFFLWLGLLVTALAGVGYGLALAELVDLDLWLGLTGGAALFASGAYLAWRWR